ncbi:MAG: 3-carboxyethylcatechol 2,3-dioxygenase, partial [Acinetobacter sp.]
SKVIAVGQKLASGDQSVAVPLNSKWDQELLELFKTADFDALVKMTEDEIRTHGGRGGQEIRCWIAALATLRTLGEYDMEIHCYEAISEWIAGFSIVSAQFQDQGLYV